MVTLAKKYCKRCASYKGIAAFAKNKSMKDGLQFYCRVCSKSTVSRSVYRHNYYLRNKEKHLEQNYRWRKENPEQWQLITARRNHARRIRRYSAEREKIDYNLVYERDSWVCQICSILVDRELQWPHPMSKSIDHIVALSNGGSDTYANVQLAHLSCNQRKGR